jgi:transcriptional regulator with XRE-family HTH domain
MSRIIAAEVGKRIVEARGLLGKAENRQIDQAELARRLGVNKESIRIWEAGEQLPSYKNLGKLAQALKVDEEWLMFGIRRGEQITAERPFLDYLSPDEQALITAFRATGPDGRKATLGAAQSNAKILPSAIADVVRLRRKDDPGS